MNSPVYRSSQPIYPRSDGWTNAAIIRTVALLALCGAVIVTLIQASDIVMTIFLGVLFGITVAGGATWLERWRIPRGISATVIVLTTLLALFGIGSYVGPTMVEQTATIRTKLPQSLKSAELWLNAHTNGVASNVLSDQTAAAAGDTAVTADVARSKRIDAGQQVSDALKIATRMVFGFLSSGITVIASVGLIFVLAIYVGADARLYARGILSLVPPSSRPRLGEVMLETANTLRRWLKVQAIAMIVIGAASYVAFKLIGVEAAFALALIAGLLEFIPTLGPIISGSIAVAMAFLDSPSKALAVLIAAVVIQQLEGNLLIPWLMKSGLDLPPALTLAAQGVMAVLFGFAGMLVAVPLLAAVIVPIRMFYIEDTLGGPVNEPAATGGSG